MNIMTSKPTDQEIREAIERLVERGYLYEPYTKPGEFYTRKVSARDKEILAYSNPSHFCNQDRMAPWAGEHGLMMWKQWKTINEKK